jgi:uncharacterized protein YrrD
MPRMSSLEGADVLNASGTRVGTVCGLVFHPSEPCVIGLAVRRPRLGGVVARQPVYIALAAVAFDERGVLLGTKRLPTNAGGAKTIGASWDDTVLWDAMPVRSSDGEPVGVVGDVAFDAATGAVNGIRVSTGIIGDMAVGRLEVPGELVEGFDGEAVIVGAGYADLEASGGVAKAAAKTATVARAVGTRVAKQAYDTGMSAAVSVGKSFKSGTGRRMLDKFRELTRDEDENEAKK